MLIVGCQNCGEAKVLAGAPDRDGVARVTWTCCKCGTGQVMQLDVTEGARIQDLRRILGGLALQERGGLPASSGQTLPDEPGMGDFYPDDFAGMTR